MPKFKKYYFDVEMLIDYSYQKVRGKDVAITTHRIFRGLSLSELVELIASNQTLDNNVNEKITFNIRGVNH